MVRKLRAAGFSQSSQRGSHVKFRKLNGGGATTTIVPRHREVSTGTLRDIIKQAGLTPQEFMDL
ncbi:MAG: type II toxin-antitoxin system HicA family toxin [Chloroflexi bacterium]|nr:type II toxin-antitoxin system HicA family toxin [Chloroflexota bacterium]